MATERILWKDTAKVKGCFTGDPGGVDLVVIGGGFTGCSAALHAAKSGARVVLLEAREIGHGGSGRNAGLVNAGLWLPPERVKKAIGRKPGERINAQLAKGPDLVFQLVREHDIKCDPVRNGTLHCANSAKGMRELEDRLEQNLALGAPVELLSKEGTERKTGSREFDGALLDRRAGTIQPKSYCMGLANAAKGLGAEIYENTPVTSVRKSGGQWIVRTARAGILTPKVILATNAYQQSIRGVKAPGIIPFEYFQFATEPIEHPEIAKVLPEGQGCWTTERVMTSFRLDAGKRLIIGSVGRLGGLDGVIHKRWAKSKLKRLYPQLARLNLSLSHSWVGRIGLTTTHIPVIVKHGEGFYSAYGYSGRGISPGTVFGKALAGHVVGNLDAGELPVRPVSRHSAWLKRLRGSFYNVGAAISHL